MTVSSSEHCWRATLELIRANPSLVKLAITIIRTEFISTSEQFDLFRLLSKLEELDMTDNYGTMDTALFLRLLTTCPQLKTLRLKASVAPDEGVSDDAAKTMPTPPPTPKPSCSSLASLQELELAVNNIRVVDHEYLLPWLKHFPSLRSFKLPDMMTRHVPEACTLFQHHLHYIEKLDLSHLHCLEDEHFAALIEACSSRYRQGGPASLHSPLPLSSPSSLESLSVSRRRMTALRELQLECCSIGFHTVKAIVTHHRDTLEVLNIRRCRESFRSEWIQSLLVSCSALRSFESGQSNGYPKIVTLNAQDMYRSRWACTNLEVLQVSITGICHQRPGPSEAAVDGVSSESSAASTLLASSPECELWSEGGDQSLLCHPHPPLAAARAHGDEGEGVQNDHAICMEIQAEVYEQLGQLRRLRRLDVGRIGKRWASEEQKRLVESSSLEWRLSSGMLGNCNDVNDGPLSRLHQLEELGLAWTEQSLGVAELEWMKRHWPRLCKIIGDEKWIQRQPDVSTWVATHWPGLEILYKSG
ncbi:hypothetical protein BGZ73_001393 [Actinomortierella ambigua]|nr:hypothetical protein BGZ73_001393 [Actinomortierella ambigua]